MLIKVLYALLQNMFFNPTQYDYTAGKPTVDARLSVPLGTMSDGIS